MREKAFPKEDKSLLADPLLVAEDILQYCYVGPDYGERIKNIHLFLKNQKIKLWTKLINHYETAGDDGNKMSYFLK